jgi:hypothetical protein
LWLSNQEAPCWATRNAQVSHETLNAYHGIVGSRLLVAMYPDAAMAFDTVGPGTDAENVRRSPDLPQLLIRTHQADLGHEQAR